MAESRGHLCPGLGEDIPLGGDMASLLLLTQALKMISVYTSSVSS
jgi:hypothetical protein